MPRTTGQTVSKKRRKKQEAAKKKDRRTARTSDRHELYELSVQETEAEIDLIDQVWKDLRGRRCVSIREDFCGTAAVCAEWVKHRAKNTAVGVDIDPEVLNWGRDRMAGRINESQAARIELIEGNVLDAPDRQIDSVLAMNFSYYLFSNRKDLLEYFTGVQKALPEDGLFMLDAYGGSDSFLEMEEERILDGFTYVWDQHFYNPITGEAVNHIHFRFPDGSEMKEAFSYHWRLWTLPEIRELLVEAGFADVVVYWEGTDEEGEGDGNWTVSEQGEADEGWIAYLVASKTKMLRP